MYAFRVPAYVMRSAAGSLARRCMSTIPDPRSIRPEDTINITKSILDKIGRDLHRKEGHPVCTLKTIVFDHFKELSSKTNGPEFKTYDAFPPVVTTKANFDDLLVPADHPSRSYSDTFYVTSDIILRPHTSAHQTQLLRQGDMAFLVAGDCYRRDEIDASHYPIFHQMEGVKVFDPKDLSSDPAVAEKQVMDDLKASLEGVATKLFGQRNMRWIDAYFPFTHPSAELEVEYNGKWLEVLGCGKIHHKIMENVGLGDRQGWAFGIGLERLAMALFDVPDIRLFWSDDPRFLNQFQAGKITKFVPFSKYPMTSRDVSFWYDPEKFHDNDFFAIVREAAGDCVENVQKVEEFVHPKTKRCSKLFRINYRSLERTLQTEEVNVWQENVRRVLSQQPGIELR